MVYFLGPSCVLLYSINAALAGSCFEKIGAAILAVIDIA